jgi:hypothetical protein
MVPFADQVWQESGNIMTVRCRPGFTATLSMEPANHIGTGL